MLEIECLHCGAEFVPNKRGHLHCSPLCRHRGPREVHERRPLDEAQVTRPFDESRDPDERARPDDWRPGPPEFAELDSFDSLEKRRRWYTSLRERGPALNFGKSPAEELLAQASGDWEGLGVAFERASAGANPEPAGGRARRCIEMTSTCITPATRYYG